MDFIIIENEKIGQVKAGLLRERNPETCKAIWDNLPFDLNLTRWGEELYGEIPVVLGRENAQVNCEVGDVGYCPDGKGFCIFFLGLLPQVKMKNQELHHQSISLLKLKEMQKFFTN